MSSTLRKTLCRLCRVVARMRGIRHAPRSEGIRSQQPAELVMDHRNGFRQEWQKSSRSSEEPNDLIISERGSGAGSTFQTRRRHPRAVTALMRATCSGVKRSSAAVAWVAQGVSSSRSGILHGRQLRRTCPKRRMGRVLLPLTGPWFNCGRFVLSQSGSRALHSSEPPQIPPVFVCVHLWFHSGAYGRSATGSWSASSNHTCLSA